ncbi:unnamed protein product [Xylocopa violacea]|uniref:Partner of bursicon n=1 Tax=Xylocopa violacea TaxID=135666 RepID=A0ABP1NUF3_XYLVO
MYTFAISLILIVLMYTRHTIGEVSDDESCETLQSEVHITKGTTFCFSIIKYRYRWRMKYFLLISDEYDEIGRLKRTCSGDVSVTKCEGFCNSQVQPSVVRTTGFLKECYCCRESYLKERHITLHHCYDADGIKLMNEEDGVMEIKIREPAECKCIKCGDTSR